MDYVHQPITADQLEALELYIWRSKDCVRKVQKIIIWLLRHSEYLTKSVALSVGQTDKLLALETFEGAHDMNSALGSTHLSIVMRATGSRFSLSQHGGIYKEGSFRTDLDGVTLWLSQIHYDHTATIIELDHEAVQNLQVPDWFTQKYKKFIWDRY